MDKIKLSVGSLIEFVMRSGDIDNSFRQNKRAEEGRKIHQKLQKEYGDYYLSEVFLKNETVFDDIVFEVEGRADGIYHKGKEVLIDEIKSTTRNLEELKYNSNPLHWAQAKCYGYFYCVKNNLEEINIQLTYYQVDTDEIKRIYESFKVENLKEFYFALLELYLDFSRRIINFRKNRDEKIRALQFPYMNYRPGQREMSVAVYNTIREKKVLLCEAATGIGKTMGTLFPSIKAIGEGELDKIFYLTARSTTKEAANKAVYKLMDRGLLFKTVTLTAKEKICINTEVKCNPKDCPFAKGHFDRVNEAIIDIYENEDILHMENIVRYAKKHKVCPMEFQLDMAIYSDLVVCDYNYAFDPIIYLRRFFDDSMERFVFLVDESHNLIDRGRDMYSSELSTDILIDGVNNLDDEDFRIKNPLNKLISQIEDFYKMGNGKEYISYYLDDEITSQVMIIMRQMEKFLADKKDHPNYEKIMEVYFELSRFLKISDFYSESFATLVYRDEDRIVFKIICLDTSKIFKSILNRTSSTIYFSATLSPIKFYGELLGAGKDFYHMRLNSPFDKDNLKVNICPISTRYLDREKNYDIIAKSLNIFTNYYGNTMLFFPSYKFLQEIYNRYDVIDKEVLIQSSNMTEEDRDLFLRKFKHDSNITAFVVLGGVFSEGIDLVGDRLKKVAVVSVGLPGLSIERNLIKDYFDKKEGKGFEYAYIYPGMNKVSQAGGRVIRDKDDKGEIILIDDRFLKSPYNKLMPMQWNKRRIVRSFKDVENI